MDQSPKKILTQTSTRLVLSRDIHRDTCHYIKVSVQDLRAIVPLWVFGEISKMLGKWGGTDVRMGQLWKYPLLNLFLYFCLAKQTSLINKKILLLFKFVVIEMSDVYILRD